jgi:outer membrane protein
MKVNFLNKTILEYSSFAINEMSEQNIAWNIIGFYSNLKYIVLVFLIACLNPIGNAQDVLTLNQAIEMALQQNTQLAIGKMNQEATGMQVYKSNAGFGPRVDWNANIGSSVNNVNQKFIDGRLINRNGRSIAPNTNLSLNWTLYDGNRMKTRYEILKAQNELAKVNVTAIADEIIQRVKSDYYAIARQKETISFQKNIIKYYEERLMITKGRWEVGRGSKLDFLQSQNDLNSQLAIIQNAELSLINQKILLNLLLNRAPEIQFDTEVVNPNTENYSFEMIYNKAILNNEEIALIDKEITINKLLSQELEGNKKPRISLNSSLGYSLNNTNAGLILLNQNIGLNGGLTSTWNLFDGNHNKKQIEIANFRNSILEKEKEQVLSRIKSEITIALNQIATNKKILELENSNKLLAEENLTIALEKFRLGGSTILELNDAQQRYDSALNRQVNAFYNAKYAELEVERISK